MDWEFSIGFYPGLLLGMRTYKERKKNNHVIYLPFVSIIKSFPTKSGVYIIG